MTVRLTYLASEHITVWTRVFQSVSSHVSSLPSKVLGDFDHEHHGVFGLVAEGFSDDVNSVLVCDSVKGDPVHRRQLKASLRTQEGKYKHTRNKWSSLQSTGNTPGLITLSTSQVEAAPPGKIFSIFTIG